MTARIFLSIPVLSFIYIVSASAQKLPNKQETGVYAPAGVKIDGNAAEWGNTFQAYNKATEISYTLANDKDNLYLICRATEVDVIQKILVGGITLTVSSDDNKTIAPVAITYPIVPFTHVQINYDMRPKAPLSDSVVSVVNKKISGHLKEIRVSGIKDITDGSVPVYNDLGITTAHHVTNNKEYTSELALPLNFIRPLLSKQGTFNYRLQVNGLDPKTTVIVGGGAIGGFIPSDEALPHGANYDMSPTYFSASYTLVEKPK